MTMKREEAISAGITRYPMAKPCSKGHLGFRYASSGQCCECVATIAQGRKDRIKQAKIVANTKNFEPARVWSGLVRPEHHATMQRLADVYAMGTPEQIEQVDAFIYMIRSQVRGLR